MNNEIKDLLAFPDSMPHLTAAYAVDQCLFLAGVQPSDWADGTALTWVVVNVTTNTLEGVFRLEPPRDARIRLLQRRGVAVRDFDRSFAYVTYRDNDGLSRVERYRLPALECGV